MIRFGIAVRQASRSDNEIINVERSSGRSAGVARTVSICRREFTVVLDTSSLTCCSANCQLPCTRMRK